MFGAININSQTTNCVVSIGENLLTGWAAHRKTNNGIAAQVGTFISTANPAFIYDFDLIDGQMNDQDLTPGVQNQSL